MKQSLGVILTAAIVGLSPCLVNATERKPSSGAPPVAVKKSTSPGEHDSPRGDTHVHRFFQAWGNGMQRGASAIGLDKNPLEGRLPEPRKPLFGGTPREHDPAGP